MARRRGKGLKVKLRDVDRGYKKLMKRLGVAAKKARRGASKSVRTGKRAAKGIFAAAAAEIKRAQKKKPTAKQMESLVVTVGIHEEQGAATHEQEDNFGEGFGQATPPTVAEVGTFHEFGLGVPQRSFIRGWADENEELNKKRLRKIADAVVNGYIPSPRMGLERFGLLAVGEIQSRMADGIEPPLAESTIKAKGSSTPLIDTGQMRSAITHKVDRRSAQSEGGGDEE